VVKVTESETNQSASVALAELPSSGEYVYASWYRDNVTQMPVKVLTRHQLDLEAKLALHEKGQFCLLEGSRMEIVEAIKVITERLDEILPKVPATIDEHDRNVGNRVHDNWPIHAQSTSLEMHLHFCELIDSWKLNPARRFVSNVSVILESEHAGISAFGFNDSRDLGDFVVNYQLGDFVVSVTASGTQNPNTLVLSNRFTKEQVHPFLDVYKSVISRLASIHDERRRATNIDGGRVGFLSVDHFHTRETIELQRLMRARMELGLGSRVKGD
jgi:hypothetical protein